MKHFTSWLGLRPNFKKTGGKVKSSKTRLGAYLRRLRSRLGAPKAITALAHKLARIFYTVMRYGVAYQKKSEEEYVNEHQKRMEQNLHRRAKELGYELKKIEAPKVEVEVAAAASACVRPVRRVMLCEVM